MNHTLCMLKLTQKFIVKLNKLSYIDMNQFFFHFYKIQASFLISCEITVVMSCWLFLLHFYYFYRIYVV